MPDLSWDQVRAWRVARHGLDERSTRRRLLSVASEICGVHAQVGSAAELSLWARVEGVTPRDVRDALWKTKRLVRSWMMRGTIHLLPARDFPLYVAALATHDRWWKGAWLRAVGMSADELGALLGAIREALSDEPITREQLASRVGHLVGDHAREHLLSGWGSLLKPAAFNGSLCSGPPRGQNVTFVRPDLWLGRWEEHDGDQAVREVFRRYLRAYGPSHHEEFAAWWGGAPAFARRARLAIEEELREIDVDDMKRWVLRRDLAAMQRTAPLRGSVRLLPHFDAYVMGFRPRDELLDKRFADRVFRKGAWISPVVLVDGRVDGVWGYERTNAGVAVTVAPFGRLSSSTRNAIAEQADRLGEFYGVPAELSIARV